MKIALCFIISYDHILNKEHIWRKWIEANKDIINVYFYYKELNKIKSKWILEHTIPPHYISKTSYYHVIPAYLSSMEFATKHDRENQWFCLLTDSCCPIISPKRFRHLFYRYHKKSILSWKTAWWNVTYHKRANLLLIPEELRLANDPYFVLKREDVNRCMHFANNQSKLLQTICSGGLANESLFAIILSTFNKLEEVVCSVTHLTDWTRMKSATSPHMFTIADEKDIQFIEKNLKENKYAMFIRKISPEFPDEILTKYIYDYRDDKLLRDPFLLKKVLRFIYLGFCYVSPILFCWYVYFMVNIYLEINMN
jgi:hypothetical protein